MSSKRYAIVYRNNPRYKGTDLYVAETTPLRTTGQLAAAFTVCDPRVATSLLRLAPECCDEGHLPAEVMTIKDGRPDKEDIPEPEPGTGLARGPSGPPLGPNQVRIWVRDPADKGPGGSVWMPAVAISTSLDGHNVVAAQVELDDGHMGEMENKDGLEIKIEQGAS